ncbi:unnamed protein product [Didymodactylos carnosus]|uniref:Aquaporin n=1 Tax=Didymodactylos carnosus TaxID=1234261 RepID=A0A814IDU5_9BILA|nr:unnamed protein product [Didymodactylos carnosus]CAF3792920.1 unnamed protein product [Didymodactylos carnosus]
MVKCMPYAPENIGLATLTNEAVLFDSHHININDNTNESAISGRLINHDYTTFHYRTAAAELVCTTIYFTLYFSIIITCKRLNIDGNSSLLIVCYSGGLLVAAFIYLFGNISGGYFSVSVSFVTVMIGKHSIRTFLLYIVAQLVGSILAVCIICILFPHPQSNGYYTSLLIIPNHGIGASRVIAMELFLSFVACYAFLTISNWHASLGPLVTGFLVSTLIFIGSTTGGGCINLARLFGPALFANIWTKQYLYWIGTWLGSTAAGFFTGYVHQKMDTIKWTDVCLEINPVPTHQRKFRHRYTWRNHFTIEHCFVL